MKKIDWIAVDWGTSHLRIWGMNDAMNDSCVTIAEKFSTQGMKNLEPNQFETILLEHIGEWLDGCDSDSAMPVIACGMAGARQGWVEAPYDKVPCLPAQNTITISSNDARIKMHVIAGLCQDNPPDVMRGEETMILGYISQQQEKKHLLCLPGTHSKWAVIDNGEVSSFQTSMSGELFALLSTQSVLRHNLGQWDDDCFIKSISATLANPEKTNIRLFNIRALNLLYNDNHGIAYLSGAIIGLELAGMKPLWQENAVTIIGDNTLAGYYKMALESQNVSVQMIDGSMLVRAGLHQIYRKLYQNA
ncbi:MAG: 2-dehydro-3-deoxygalactonokinase [Alphaproteobacteria bacterium]|nr:2-dehydro-3-deoxygalactonokinase [Alphaproteobacteria bacterium]